jgi:hypothetical protein
VRLAATVMPAFAERDAVAHEDAADGRIGGRVRDRARREFAGAREIRDVGGYGRTSTPFQKATNPSMFFASSDAWG